MPPRRRQHEPDAPTVGDRRRAGLLDALRDLLAERPLADVSVGQVTARAGVARSSFYFYFPTKGAAVAALLHDVEERMIEAGSDWYDDRSASPRVRVERGFARTLAFWREHASALVALLDAAAADRDVRADWDAWTQGFVDRVARRIEEDRRAGVARDGAEPRALATVLLGAALFGVEREVRAVAAGAPPSDDLVPALVEVWLHALYAEPDRVP